MEKRYIVKKTKEKKRGEAGYLDVYYVFDLKMNKSVTGTIPSKEDATHIARLWNDNQTRS